MTENVNQETFFQLLPAYKSFNSLDNYENFEPAPDDWLIVVADIRGSTKAVQDGRYKDVNTIGASAIIAVLNIDRTILLPFVFGGDGATLLVPPSMADACRQQLPGLIDIAEKAFDLKLCLGLVPIHVTRLHGHDVRILKYEASKNYYQAMILGGGVSFAEKLVKDEVEGKSYRLQITDEHSVDLTGLECRWQDIPSSNGETVSLLVQVIGVSTEQSLQIYQKVIQLIMVSYGQDVFQQNIDPASLQLSQQFSQLAYEAKAKHQSGLARVWHILKSKGLNWLGSFLMKHHEAWKGYKQHLIETSDHKKFDDLLRLVLSGNTSQRQELVHELDALYQSGQLVYGFHVSDRALMTCLVMDRFGQQVHFLDGADGGYTQAATMMKRQLRNG
jgi:hypothetical protein